MTDISSYFPQPGDPQATESITARLTPVQLAKLHRLARASNTDLGAIIRQALDALPDVEPMPTGGPLVTTQAPLPGATPDAIISAQTVAAQLHPESWYGKRPGRKLTINGREVVVNGGGEFLAPRP